MQIPTQPTQKTGLSAAGNNKEACGRNILCFYHPTSRSKTLLTQAQPLPTQQSVRRALKRMQIYANEAAVGFVVAKLW